MTYASWYARQCIKYGLSLIPASLRIPRGLRNRITFLEHSQLWSRDRIAAYQLEQLNRILRWAEQHIPYYRNRSPGNLPLRDFADLSAWPLTDRRIVNQDPGSFQFGNLPPWRLRHGTTSGRTGTPLRIPWEWPSSTWWEEAHVRRAMTWAGIGPDIPVAILRGNKVHGPRGPETRSVQFVPHRNRLVLSLFQLNEETVIRYVDQMNAHGVRALQAYPSAVIRFVRLLEERGCAPPELKAVCTSSEQLGSSERIAIEQFFGVRVFDLYGHAERAVAAAQCEEDKEYHVFDEYGFLELVDTNGSPCTPGKVGEIVATGFLNRAMPFIRYRTGDFAEFSRNKCPCGRNLTVLSSLYGRPPEYLLDPQGNPISIRMGLGHEALKGIIALRFYQSRPGHAVLHVVPGKNEHNDYIRGRLLKEFDQRFGNRMEFDFKFVDFLEPGPDGRQNLVHRSDEMHGECV